MPRADRIAGVVVLLLAYIAALPRATAAKNDAPAKPALRSIATYLHGLVSRDSAFDTDTRRTSEDLSRDMRAIYASLQYVLSDDLRAQFLGLSNDDLRREWIRRYWALRDPTPTTPRNERLEEHERRVSVARQRFATTEPPFWDARGAFCIPFGEPASVRRELSETKIAFGYIPAREIWSYPDAGLVAVFEQPSPGGPWLLGRSSMKQTTRRDLLEDATSPLHHKPSSDDEPPSLDQLAPDPRFEFLEPYVPGRSLVAAAAVTESHQDRFVMPSPTQRPLWFVFDSDAFRRETARTRVEVHVQFDLRDLEFQWQDSLYTARWRLEGVLLDEAVQVAGRDAYESTARALAFRTTNQPILWPAQLDFDVEPGLYRLAVRLVDERTGGEGTYEADVLVPQLARPELVLSDLEMATWVDSAGAFAGSRFEKAGRLVVPNPISTYRRDKPLVAYLEIYGLRLDAQHMGRYRFSYTVVSWKRKDRGDWVPQAAGAGPAVTSSFEARARQSDAVEEVRIDVAALEPGAYALEIQVEDLIAGTSSATRGRFWITD